MQISFKDIKPGMKFRIYEKATGKRCKDLAARGMSMAGADGEWFKCIRYDSDLLVIKYLNADGKIHESGWINKNQSSMLDERYVVVML